MQAVRSSAMRSARAARVAAPTPAPMMRSAVIQRRFATKVEQTAEKVKEAAESLNPAHHKASSDVPWMVGSVLVFAPLLVWMTSPSSKKEHHHEPKKEKYKPHLRLPPSVEEDSPEAAKQPEAPEEFNGVAGEGRPHGEGDHALRAKQEENVEHQDKQKQGSDTETTADNHSTGSGLKGNAAKFQAAARGSQIANESGGGEAARDTKAITQAGKATGSEAEQGQPKETGYKSGTVPADAGEKIGEHITKQQDARSEESDKEDSGENKDEQL